MDAPIPRRALLQALAASGCLLAAGPAGAAGGSLVLLPGQGAGPQNPDDARRVDEFLRLEPRARQRVLDRWRWNLAGLSGRAAALGGRAREGLGTDPGLLEPARPPRWFDPKVHAPAQPIPRRLAPPRSAALVAMERRLALRRPARAEVPGYAYDFGLGEVVRLGTADAPERIFANGLLGRHPDWDLWEAAAAKGLDDRSQQKALDAFGHCYTTREGLVLESVTLLDAWSSGLEMEMPDVDVLGLYHTLTGDLKTYVAPIPSSRHRELYGRLGELFLPARRIFAGISNLARAYASAAPVLVDGWSAQQVLACHGFWLHAGEDPASARPLLPDPKGDGWSRFTGDWQRRLGAEPELLARARAREAELASEAREVAELLRESLREEQQRPPSPK